LIRERKGGVCPIPYTNDSVNRASPQAAGKETVHRRLPRITFPSMPEDGAEDVLRTPVAGDRAGETTRTEKIVRTAMSEKIKMSGTNERSRKIGTNASVRNGRIVKSANVRNGKIRMSASARTGRNGKSAMNERSERIGRIERIQANVTVKQKIEDKTEYRTNKEAKAVEKAIANTSINIVHTGGN
jgi:hypothetical protein